MVKRTLALVLFLCAFSVQAKKLNLIIVSLCSTNRDFFSNYNKDGATPKLQSLAKETLVFDKSLGNNSWTSIFKHIRYYGDFNQYMDKQGYEVLGQKLAFESRPRFNPHTQPVIKPTERDNIGNYMGRIKKEIQAPHKRPFAMFLHLKDLHFPYTDNDVIHHAGDYFSKDKYDNFPRLPFFYHLYHSERIREFFDDTWHKFRNDEELYGYIQSPSIMKGWMKHKRYQEDLETLKKQYRKKVKTLDRALYPLLNLFGDKKLQKNTLVLLTGDHGEAFMDHNVLGHGAHVYDEFLRIPTLVINPALSGMKYQDHYHTLQDLWYAFDALIKGEITRKNIREFPKFIRKRENILQHNCAGDVFSLRNQKGMKVLKFLKENRYELYDLEKDPRETQDLWSSVNRNERDRYQSLVDQHIFEYFSRVKKEDSPLPKWTACFGDHWSNPMYKIEHEKTK